MPVEIKRKLSPDKLPEDRDAFGYFLQDIKSIPLLTAEQEIALAEKKERGDKEAFEDLVMANIRLVINIAKRYQDDEIKFSDLVLEGYFGLRRAVEKFDPERGFRLVTYATPRIKWTIEKAKAGKLVSNPLPQRKAEAIKKMKRVVEDLEQRLGREPRDEEIAQEMNLKPQGVSDLQAWSLKLLSLDEGEKGDDPEVPPRHEYVEDRLLSSNPEAYLEKAELDRFIRESFSELPPEQAKVLRLRYGFEDGRSWTRGEIGLVLGKSDERVRQIEEEALIKAEILLGDELVWFAFPDGKKPMSQVKKDLSPKAELLIGRGLEIINSTDCGKESIYLERFAQKNGLGESKNSLFVWLYSTLGKRRFTYKNLVTFVAYQEVISMFRGKTNISKIIAEIRGEIEKEVGDSIVVEQKCLDKSRKTAYFMTSVDAFVLISRAKEKGLSLVVN